MTTAPGRVGLDEGGRPSGRPVEGRRAFGDELAGDQLADQRPDRAAGETRARDQVGAGQRSTTMELPDDRPQVRATDGLAPMTQLVSTDHHRVCVPLYQMSVRDWNNGPAVSSRVRAGPPAAQGARKVAVPERGACTLARIEGCPSERERSTGVAEIDGVKAMTTASTRSARLADVPLPDFGRATVTPEIPAALYADRLERLRERIDRRGYDVLVVWADREHSANLSFLTGFDPRFEEAILIVGRRGNEPAILVGNECWGTAGAAPLPMRRHLFQDLSLPSQPRDRSAPLDEVLRGEGIEPGSRVGVVGWKTYADRATMEAPAFLVDALRAIVGRRGRRGERDGPPDRPGGRTAGHQRGRAARRDGGGGLHDLEWRPRAPGRPPTRASRARCRGAARLGRLAALVPPDADRRRAGPVRAPQPERPGDRARRPVHGRLRDLGRPQLPGGLRGRGGRRAARRRSRITSSGSSARISRPSPSGTARCGSARPAARCTRSSSAGWVTRSSASS